MRVPFGVGRLLVATALATRSLAARAARLAIHATVPAVARARAPAARAAVRCALQLRLLHAQHVVAWHVH